MTGGAPGQEQARGRRRGGGLRACRCRCRRRQRQRAPTRAPRTLPLSAASRARLERARQLLVHAFVRAYPALAAGVEGAKFVYQASYLLGAPAASPPLAPSSSSPPASPPPAFFSPALHLLRQTVVRVSGPELAEAEAARAAARARSLASARRRGLLGGGGGPGAALAAPPSSPPRDLRRGLPPRRGPALLLGRLGPLPIGADPRGLRLQAPGVVVPQRGAQDRRRRDPKELTSAAAAARGAARRRRGRPASQRPLRLRSVPAEEDQPGSGGLQRLRLLLPVPPLVRFGERGVPRDEAALRDRRGAEAVPGELREERKRSPSPPAL